MTLVEPCSVLNVFDGGGLGQLLRCRDAVGNVFVAKLPKDVSLRNQELVTDEERRFCRHQGRFVVRYFGPIRDPRDGRTGFAMELMDGSLAELVAIEGPLRPAEAIGHFTNIARGLKEVHSAPMAYHGDIKLANVLHKNGTAKLADFGLARGGVGQTTMLGWHQGGTPGYMPPEGYASPKGDVYSAGCVLWAMLAGREPSAPPGLHDDFSRGPLLAQLLAGMLERDPNQRWSIHQVVAALSAVEAEAKPAPAIWSRAFGGLLVLGLLGFAFKK